MSAWTCLYEVRDGDCFVLTREQFHCCSSLDRGYIIHLIVCSKLYVRPMKYKTQVSGDARLYLVMPRISLFECSENC